MLFKHRLKPEQGELELIGDILTIIDTNPDKGLLIKNFSKYFLNFVKNSQFEFTIVNDNTRFIVGYPMLRLWPEKRWCIEIEYWQASEHISYCDTTPKSANDHECIKATLNLIYNVENGILVPPPMVQGFLTKEQYLDALYERLNVLEGKKRKIHKVQFVDNQVLVWSKIKIKNKMEDVCTVYYNYIKKEELKCQ